MPTSDSFSISVQRESLYRRESVNFSLRFVRIIFGKGAMPHYDEQKMLHIAPIPIQPSSLLASNNAFMYKRQCQPMYIKSARVLYSKGSEQCVHMALNRQAFYSTKKVITTIFDGFLFSFHLNPLYTEGNTTQTPSFYLN